MKNTGIVIMVVFAVVVGFVFVAPMLKPKQRRIRPGQPVASGLEARLKGIFWGMGEGFSQ